MAFDIIVLEILFIADIKKGKQLPFPLVPWLGHQSHANQNSVEALQ